MKFMHIAPAPMLDVLCSEQENFLTLAHLFEENLQYADWFRNLTRKPNSVVHLDNSGFEQYKKGEPMFPPERLLSIAQTFHPDTIVMSDYPGERGSKTIAAAEELSPIFKQAGYETFFVPQSEVGDLEDYIQTFAWAAESPLVDWIGVSILGVPNAYGVERDNKLQRFMSRWRMMNELRSRGILRRAAINGKSIHFLGAVDGYREVELLKDFNIDSWDSSSAPWAGLNGIAYDNSPTGLINGKFEKEVDFDFHTTDTDLINLAKANMKKIDDLCL